MQHIPTPSPSFAAISSYNLINYFVPGVVFVYFIENLTTLKITSGDILVDIILYFVLGIAVNRFGSLFLKDYFRVLANKKVIRNDYVDYVNAIKQDSELKLINEMTDLYKTFATILLLLPLIKLFEFTRMKYDFVNEISIPFTLALLLVLSIMAFNAQEYYSSKRIARIKDKQK